jgi:phosphoglycerate kinase
MSIDKVDVEGKFVLLRADFNVPLDHQGRITDDRRIVQALPTIQHILRHDGRLIMMSHLGRPKGRPDPGFSLEPVARRLGELLDQDVPLIADYVAGDKIEAISSLRKGKAVLLENLRFHSEETITGGDTEANPPMKIRKRQFARKLADLGEVYVNDAFGTCHRDHASMLTVPLLMNDQPRATGFLVQKELKFLREALIDPARPFVCLLGGAKVSDKIGVIEALIPRCDAIMIGGAMAFTFMLARGDSVGSSLAEPEKIDQAKRLMDLAGDKLKLPVDVVCAAELKEGAAHEVVSGPIASGMKGLDIGSQTIAGYCDILATARTIVWNGPMGVFETKPFDAGTLAIARAVAEVTDGGAISIVGGGDSAAALIASGIEDRITHVSTGGGACLEFLEGRQFPALDVLDDA